MHRYCALFIMVGINLFNIAQAGEMADFISTKNFPALFQLMNNESCELDNKDMDSLRKFHVENNGMETNNVYGYMVDYSKKAYTVPGAVLAGLICMAYSKACEYKELKKNMMMTI